MVLICFHGVKSLGFDGEVESLHFLSSVVKLYESDAISLHDLPLSENMSNFESFAMRSVATTVQR